MKRTPVRFGWEKIAIAELRDLNRHRTGTKLSFLKPNGFSVAEDQTPDPREKKLLLHLAKYPLSVILSMQKQMEKHDHTYIYYALLGHTIRFEHVTTLDKYLYEAELRTSIGAHYRYAYQLRNTLHQLYKLHPELKGVIKEGRGEPE